MAGLVHDAVLGSLRRLSQKHRIKPLAPTQIGNTEDEMINKLRIHHGFQVEKSCPAKNANREFGEESNTNSHRTLPHYLIFRELLISESRRRGYATASREYRCRIAIE